VPRHPHALDDISTGAVTHRPAGQQHADQQSRSSRVAYVYYALTLFRVPHGADVTSAYKSWFDQTVYDDEPVTAEQAAAWAKALPRLRELGPGAEDTIEEGDGERTWVSSYGYTYECGVEVGYHSNDSADVEVPITKGRLEHRHLGARATAILAEVTGLTPYDDRAGRRFDGHLPEYVTARQPAAPQSARPWWKRLLGLG
jgi:hypothetical protein